MENSRFNNLSFNSCLSHSYDMPGIPDQNHDGGERDIQSGGSIFQVGERASTRVLKWECALCFLRNILEASMAREV